MIRSVWTMSVSDWLFILSTTGKVRNPQSERTLVFS